MIISLVFLIIIEICSWHGASCYSLVKNENIDESTKIMDHRSIDENSIIADDDDDLREMRNATGRFQRDTKNLNSEKSSLGISYETAMNQTIVDYYAQRKAVMERYYARQREIIEKFGRKTTTESSRSPALKRPGIIDDVSATSDAMIVDDANEFFKIIENKRIENFSVADETKIFEDDEARNSSNVSWIYRFNDWNPTRLRDNETDMDFQAESSNIPATRFDKSEIPGYYRLGEFKGSDNEKIVYQHNLGVGLKGSSQLEANFEAVLEGAFAITAIEAFPYAGTRAHFSWISGGPGANYVKLKLKGYENEGFSYTVKVWAVPI